MTKMFFTITSFLLTVILFSASGCLDSDSKKADSQDTVGGSNEHTADSTSYAEELLTGRKGNSAGNIANLGLAAIQDEWIYYVNDTDDYSIYKIRTDGSGRTKINDDNSRYLNVVGDWIYYSNYELEGLAAAEFVDPNRNYNIYKIRTDGNERTQINDDNSLGLKVIDGWIYYRNFSDDGKLYKIRTDGSDRTKLTDDVVLFINIEDDWIYYINESDSHKIYKIDIDGTNRKCILDEAPTCYYLNVVDDWFYFTVMMYGERIHKLRVDGSEGREVSNGRHAHYLNTDGNRIYFINLDDNGEINSISLEGNERVRINDDTSWLINIVGDWVYYSNKDDNEKFYRIRTDGSDRQIIN